MTKKTTTIVEWGKSTPKPYYRYINGRVSRHDGPVDGKVTVLNSGPFGLRFVGQLPPQFIIQMMFNGLMTKGVIPSSVFYTKFKEKRKVKNKFWKFLCFLWTKL